MTTDLIGARLGKYEIQAEIGRGGMGAVYKGYDPLLDRPVAIKVLAPHLAWEPGFVERFLREARAAARLKHPYIVTIYDVGQEGNWHYFVMEYLAGQTLTEVIRQRGPLSSEEALSILNSLAAALDYAHAAGLVHRDIKPGNVIVGPTGQVTLTDFGIARAAQETQLTATGALMGTPAYMSPEQAKGLGVDARSDQYSLAVVAYEMLTGRVPFQGDTLAVLHAHAYEPPPPIRQARPDLPAAMEVVLIRALAKEPDARYPAVGAFAEALEQALTGQAAVSLAEPPMAPAVRMAPAKKTSMRKPRRPKSRSAPASAQAGETPTPTELSLTTPEPPPLAMPSPVEAAPAEPPTITSVAAVSAPVEEASLVTEPPMIDLMPDMLAPTEEAESPEPHTVAEPVLETAQPGTVSRKRRALWPLAGGGISLLGVIACAAGLVLVGGTVVLAVLSPVAAGQIGWPLSPGLLSPALGSTPGGLTSFTPAAVSTPMWPTGTRVPTRPAATRVPTRPPTTPTSVGLRFRVREVRSVKSDTILMSVRVLVLGANDRGIPGIRVRIDSGGPWRLEAITDSGGRCEFNALSANRYNITLVNHDVTATTCYNCYCEVVFEAY